MPLSLDDIDAIAAATPVIADLKPGGQYTAVDLWRTGGAPRCVRELLDGKRIADVPTVSGCTLAEEIAGAPRATTLVPEVVRPMARALKERGGFAILRGSLAPDGCVVKLAGHGRQTFSGPARVFDREEAAFAAVQEGRIQAGDVVVIRGEGPGRRAGHARDAGGDRGARRARARRRRRARDRRALLGRDARPHGRARRAGSGARRADRRACATATASTIDVAARAHRRRRRSSTRRDAYHGARAPRGVLGKYLATVSSASEGAVTTRR